MRLIILITTFIASVCHGEIMEGRVVRIVDGDTLVVLDADKLQQRVRLAGIDTPERGQHFGKRAKQNLSRLAS